MDVPGKFELALDVFFLFLFGFLDFGPVICEGSYTIMPSCVASLCLLNRPSGFVEGVKSGIGTSGRDFSGRHDSDLTRPIKHEDAAAIKAF